MSAYIYIQAGSLQIDGFDKGNYWSCNHQKIALVPNFLSSVSFSELATTTEMWFVVGIIILCWAQVTSIIHTEHCKVHIYIYLLQKCNEYKCWYVYTISSRVRSHSQTPYHAHKERVCSACRGHWLWMILGSASSAIMWLFIYWHTCSHVMVCPDIPRGWGLQTRLRCILYTEPANLNVAQNCHGTIFSWIL